jgi:outer membrane protein insertion porin family
VTVDTPESQGTTDQVDVNIAVVEKPTGNFMIGGAFSQAEKFTFTASVSRPTSPAAATRSASS